jgi:dGTP triphosphohydrolase
MDQSALSLIVAVIALFISIASYIITGMKQNVNTSDNTPSTTGLQLQAYERLVMLTERISLPNLISRTIDPKLSAKEMQIVLLQNIKQEFEYNATQQIYVSKNAWNAVQTLKDQNLLTINQISNVLDPEAKASDLSKQLLEVMMNQKEKALHTMVLEALNCEAKKIMK